MASYSDKRLYRLIGERISSARTSVGLSQNKLAKKLDLSRVSIVNIEKGRQRPPVHVLWKIAEALGIEITDLIPSLAQIANAETSVHLDDTTVSMIEDAANDDPATLRRLTEFIKHARAKLDARVPNKETNAS
jgi:transcriptional regulator with XRE-family HTH domain